MQGFLRSKLVLSLAAFVLIAAVIAIPLSGSSAHLHAQAPTPTPIPTPTPTPTFSGLHVSGNKLVNMQGQTVVLHGVNRSGTEYMCVQGNGIFDGPSDVPSVQAIKSWNVNVVRIPLNEDCWLNINGVLSQYSGINYQTAIVNYVNILTQNNLYAILDLHWSAPGGTPATGQEPMPDADNASAFWSSVATTFLGNNNVLFDVFNEPQLTNSTASWQCWKNGGICKGIAFPTVGMQSLVTTIRNTGASNVILLGGLQYANNLSDWLKYKPVDPLNNLAASWHVYPQSNPCHTTSCYQKQVAPVANRVPLIAGEIGESADGSVCGVSETNTVLNWLDKHQASYLAWAWDTWGTSCGDLSLITDYTGTPKSPNGVNYQSHLLNM